MRPLHRGVYVLTAISLFSSACLFGWNPQTYRASAAAPGGDSDADLEGTDLGANLPADVQRRLARISPSQDFRPAITFWEVLGKVKSRYVDRITDQDKLARGAIGGMLRFLRDPYSRLISPDALSLLQQQQQGHYSGVGLMLGARLSGKQEPVRSELLPSGPPRRIEDTNRVWQLVVVDVVPGSAAERAGVKTGDVISKINSNRIDRPPLSKDTIDDLNVLLNGPSTKKATLTVLRPSTDRTMDFSMIATAPAAVNPVESRKLPGSQAYLRVRLFTPDAGAEVDRELNELSGSGDRSLVLDLRDNPGGSLEAALHTIGALAGGGTAALLDTKARARDLPAGRSSFHGSFRSIRLLVDSGTSGVAELVAGALHEKKQATLEGEPTFGNGLVQSLFPVKDGYSYELTTGCMRTPAGVDFNEHGLAVDRTLDPAALHGDDAITAALSSTLARR